MKYWQLMKILYKAHTKMRNEYYEYYETNEASVMKLKLKWKLYCMKYENMKLMKPKFNEIEQFQWYRQLWQ